MADQTPLVPYGLAESIDIFFVQQLRLLFQFYTNQQGEQRNVAVQTSWNKIAPTDYPFVGVMTFIPKYAPMFIGDAQWAASQGMFTGTINDAKVGIHIEAVELRELARVREFIYLNLERGSNPYTQEPWLHFFADNNVVIKYFDMSEPDEVNLETIQQRTQRAQGKELAERTDIETLWFTDMDICCDVAFNVPMFTTQGVIQGLQLNMQVDESLEKEGVL